MKQIYIENTHTEQQRKKMKFNKKSHHSRETELYAVYSLPYTINQNPREKEKERLQGKISSEILRRTSLH